MRKYVTQIFTCGEESGVWLAGKRLSATAVLQRNAIDTQRYLYAPETSAAVRKSLGIPANCLVLGHVGSFWKLKNQSFLIDVFRILNQRYPQSRLVLVGEGELRTGLMQKVKDLKLDDSVMFLGTRSDVPDLLKAFDVFVLPSMGEGFSIVTLEAQCSGLACVTTTLPKEVVMTDLISSHSLDEPLDIWVAAIEKALAKGQDRTIYPAMITEKGYDIKKNAEWLQNYYLEQWQKH